MSVADPVLSQYQWLVVVGAFAAFLFGFGTGSNDVANAFGTSVGAKTLTLRQAVIIAAVFEFTGAMVLGRVSTSVISGGIASVDTFARQPEMFAYGMVCALTVSGVWQIVCSYFELNVSSTHSIIGSIIGFSLVFAGSDGVLWQTKNTANFPPYNGVVPIVVSWFFSPIFTGLAAMIFFFTIRFLVLRHENAYTRAFWLLPPLVCITVFICIFFVFTKGAKKTFQQDDDSWTDSKSAWVSAIIAGGMGVLTALILLPILKSRAGKRFNEDGTLKEEEPKTVAGKDLGSALDHAEAGKDLKLEGHESPSSSNAGHPAAHEPKWKQAAMNAYSATKKALLHGTTVDIFEVVEEDPIINAIHERAEVFDPKAEYALQYLQVFSAICVVFAHGAGEVGYMAGPLASIWYIYTEGKMTKNVQAPAWVVFIGAFGLVLGLATYGYNVTRAMGVRLSKLSPSRGFCAELATALVIMIASQYGLPTSSSQCITGGIIGVGMMEGIIGVNWKFFAKQFASWIATLFISGLLTGALFAQGVYSPSLISGNAQVYYEDQLVNISNTMVNNFRSSLMNFQQAATDGVIPGLTSAQVVSWNSTLTTQANKTKNAVAGTVAPETMVNYLNQALSIYQANTVLTIGQVKVLPKAPICSNNVTSDIQSGNTVACPTPSLLAKGVASTWPPQ